MKFTGRHEINVAISMAPVKVQSKAGSGQCLNPVISGTGVRASRFPI